MTPLHVATHYNNEDVARLLLRYKADPESSARNGFKPLHIAARRNHLIAATLLLDEYNANPDALSKNGFTPLHLASQEGHREMVTLLLNHAATADPASNNGLRPLHLAAQEDHVPVAEVLVDHMTPIDPETKAGYTPLHTACHFGQLNMIRYLLEHGSSVGSVTKEGYTPLHQAAQQGHVLVINLLLKYNASPNALTNANQTPMAIAQRLGYVSVVDILDPITAPSLKPTHAAVDDKYRLLSPEQMQDSYLYDSDDDVGFGSSSPSPLLREGVTEKKLNSQDTLLYLTQRGETLDGGRSLDIDELSPDGESDILTKRMKKGRDLFAFDRPHSEHNSTISSSGHQTIQDELRYMADEGEFNRSYVTLTQEEEEKLQIQTSSPSYALPNLTSTPLKGLEVDVGGAGGSALDGTNYSENGSRMYSSMNSYSAYLSDSSYSQDNITADRSPQHSGFLVSFVVDARGGAMCGWRHSGVRIIIPPGKTCQPIRVTCKLVRKEKLAFPPPLMEGEALASRILQMGPPGAQFEGPVIIEVPHFASLRNPERVITILRSDDGETWKEHSVQATEVAIQDALSGSFEALESAEELYHRRVTRILTTKFPRYFAVVTSIHAETAVLGPTGGVVNSTVVEQVEAIVPQGAFNKNIKISLQAQPVPDDLVPKFFGQRASVSPVVTMEPRRRKFHRPVTLTIPLPATAHETMLKRPDADAPSTLRLLCCLTEGASPSKWEDITNSTPFTIKDNCVSFNTTVSGRFWFVDCSDTNNCVSNATELYRELNVVPFVSKFVVFAKRRAPKKGQLRVFCVTDDKLEKTLESQERFLEVARSRDIEVLDGKPQYIEMSGNLMPVTKSDDEQLNIKFRPFRENRLSFAVVVPNMNMDPTGRMAFMREPKSSQSAATSQAVPVCNLNISLPDYVREESATSLHIDSNDSWTVEEQQSAVELRLPEIAEMLDSDWMSMAHHLGIREKDILSAQMKHPMQSDQALDVFYRLLRNKGKDATISRVENALRRIGRKDIVRKYIYRTEETTEVLEERIPPKKPVTANGEVSDYNDNPALKKKYSKRQQDDAEKELILSPFDK